MLPSTNVGAATVTGDRQAPWLGAELLDVEEEKTKKTEEPEEGNRQDAVARYGSHNGSTSDRCRSRQRCPSGGAGFTFIVQPSSDRS